MIKDHHILSHTQWFSAGLGSAAAAPPPVLDLGERTPRSKYQSGPPTADNERDEFKHDAWSQRVSNFFVYFRVKVWFNNVLSLWTVDIYL